MEASKTVSSKPMGEWGMMDFLQHDLQRDVEYAKERLYGKAKDIRDRMTKVIEGLERSPETFSVNSLGELQGSGPEFDRLCAEFSMLREVVAKVRNAHAKDEDDAEAKYGAQYNSFPALLAFVHRVAYEPVGVAEATCREVLATLTAEARDVHAAAKDSGAR